MAQIVTLSKIINGEIGTSATINSNFAIIKSAYNTHDSAITGVHDIGSETIATNVYLQTLFDLFYPVGTVLDVWRPSALIFGTSIDEDIFAIMDGSIISDVGGFFDTVALPDMTNRYFIGAGTEEGENNLSSALSMEVPVGTALHLISISHLNTFPDHTHEHRHTGSTHTHNGDTTASSGVIVPTYPFLSVGAYFSQKIPTPISHPHNYYVTANPWQSSSVSSSSDIVPMAVFSTDSFTNESGSTTVSNTTSANNTDIYTGTGVDFDIQPSSLPVKRYIRYK
jgi:hypothetical protein